MVESNYFRRWKCGESCPGFKSKTERDLYKVWQKDQKSWSTGFARLGAHLESFQS